MIDAKEVSVEGLEKIGAGLAGEVYRTKDKVIKIYYDRFPREKVETFYKIARYTMQKDLPVIKVYDFVTCNGRYGMEYEYVNAPSLLDYVGTDVEKRYEAAGIVAKVLKSVHQLEPREDVFPKAYDTMLSMVVKEEIFTEEELEKVKQILKMLCIKDIVCYGDMHEGNILKCGDSYRMIDLDTLGIGNPLMDFAYLYSGHKIAPVEICQKKFGVSPKVMQEYVLRLLEVYFETTDRKLLKQYDDIFTEASEFYIFMYTAIAAKAQGQEAVRSFVEKEFSAMVERMEQLKERIGILPW